MALVRSSENSIEVIKMKGNFWKTHGYSVKAQSFLYPEESLYLLEKGKIVIHNEKSENVLLPSYYASVIDKIDLACYLAYIKLKVRNSFGLNCF